MVNLNSKIEWTDTTWSPVTGCTEVSEGCDHCYAKTFAERWRGTPGHPYEQGFDLKLWPERLELPSRWRKPRRVFVNSMSDLFHDQIPDQFIVQVFDVMANAYRHTFQVLTKRPGRMASFVHRYLTGEFVEDWQRGPLVGELPRNIWLGTSVENQKWAGVRIPKLLECPAAVRFLSCEPLLGPVTLDPEQLGHPWARANAHSASHPRHILGPVEDDDGGWSGHMVCEDDGTGDPFYDQPRNCGFDTTHHGGIDWVIVGGESGPGARLMDVGWAIDLVEQCQAATVAVFVKQLGTRRMADGVDWPCLDPKGGDPAEWPAMLRVREYPNG